MPERPRSAGSTTPGAASAGSAWRAGRCRRRGCSPRSRRSPQRRPGSRRNEAGTPDPDVQLPSHEHEREHDEERHAREQDDRCVAALDHERRRAAEDGCEQRRPDPVEGGRWNHAGPARHGPPGDGQRSRHQGEVDEEDRAPGPATTSRPPINGPRPAASATEPPTIPKAPPRRAAGTSSRISPAPFGKTTAPDTACATRKKIRNREARSERGTEGGQAEDDEPSDHEPATTVTIAELAGDRLHHREGEQVRGDEPAGGTDRWCRSRRRSRGSATAIIVELSGASSALPGRR